MPRMSQSNSAQPSDKRNIEIKARIDSDADFENRLKIARNLTKSDGQLIEQKDVFFVTLNMENGARFKLRYLEPPARSQLVYYVRPDLIGPKLSKYNIVEVDEPAVLEKILAQSNGVLGTLEKKRFLFMYGQTRIHLDKVTNLGNFMEFEVCLEPHQTIVYGEKVANELMNIFGITENHLMFGSYFDELRRQKARHP